MRGKIPLRGRRLRNPGLRVAWYKHSSSAVSRPCTCLRHTFRRQYLKGYISYNGYPRSLWKPSVPISGKMIFSTSWTVMMTQTPIDNVNRLLPSFSPSAHCFQLQLRSISIYFIPHSDFGLSFGPASPLPSTVIIPSSSSLHCAQLRSGQTKLSLHGPPLRVYCFHTHSRTATLILPISSSLSLSFPINDFHFPFLSYFLSLVPYWYVYLQMQYSYLLALLAIT